MSKPELVASGSMQARRLIESLPGRLESNESAAAGTSLLDRLRGLAYLPVRSARMSPPRNDDAARSG